MAKKKHAKDASEKSVEKAMETAGGAMFKQGVKHAVTGMTGSRMLGEAAAAATSLAPERAKSGAAVGALVGSTVATHAMALGTTGGMAFGLAVLGPFALGGAVVVGGLAWLLGDTE